MTSFPDPASKYETPDEIAAHIDRLMAEAEAMLVGPMPNPVRGKLDDVRFRLAEAQEKLADLYGSAHRTVIGGIQAADDAIRAHPFRSVAIALGVGYLVGKIIAGGGEDD